MNAESLSAAGAPGPVETVRPARSPESVAPTVSVVIPCYNYGRYLADCVGSVLDQGIPTRVLVIDDASTDGSWSVGEELAERHDEVTFRRHEANIGHIATYNEGLLEWADGDYMVLISADDRLAPGALARAVAVMEQHPSVGMVYGHPLQFSDTQAPRQGRSRPAGVVVWERRRWLERRFREAVNVVSTPTVVVRSTVQRAAGGYDAAHPHAGDLEMWLRIATLADVAYVSGPAQAYYRVHAASMSQHVYRDKLADVQERRRVFDSVVARHAAELDAFGVDTASAYRALASEPLWAACRAYEKATVDSEPVRAWVDFAAATCPDLTGLPAYRALRRRERLGARICHSTQLFAPTAAWRRARNLLWWERWKRRGA